MLFGSDDGSVFVRHVSRIEGTGDINVRLLSVAAPSAKATTPSKVSCMWYESVRSRARGSWSGAVAAISCLKRVNIKP
jgi:hypothetical protein